MNSRKPIDWAEVRGRLQTTERVMENALNPDEEAVQRILEQRAKQLAKRHLDNGPADESVGLLVFRSGTQRYGVALETVAEVGPLVRCTAVPGGPIELYGVMNHRGEVRSVIDFDRLIGHERIDLPEEDEYFIHIRQAGRELRLRVDELEQVLEVPASRLAVAQEPDVGEPGSCGIGLTDEGIVILQPEALLSASNALLVAPNEQIPASSINDDPISEDISCV